MHCVEYDVIKVYLVQVQFVSRVMSYFACIGLGSGLDIVWCNRHIWHIDGGFPRTDKMALRPLEPIGAAAN